MFMPYTNTFSFSFQKEKSSHSFFGKDISPFHMQKGFGLRTPIFKHNNKYSWKQKRRGSIFLRAYPRSQAFALPPSKDKQRKPAHVEWYY